MNIEEIYDLELKYQEVYKRTKDYTRNDFVIELIKKDDENQQLKEQLEASEKARKEATDYIKGAGEMATYTKSIALYEEELKELLEILDIDKGE